MIDLSNLIRSAVDCGASDIHLTVGKPPVFRLHGALVEQGEALLEPEDTRQAAGELASREQMDVLEQMGEVDFATTYQEIVRMRCNVFFQRGCMALELRLLPMRIPSAE